MIKKTPRKLRRQKRHQRIRLNIFGTSLRPRLSIYKSNKHIYAQLIDDTKSHTLLSVSTLQPDLKSDIKKPWTKEAAKTIGELVAKNALGKGIKKIVFDRAGNKYHGKVLAIAEAVRKGGLEF